MIDLDVTEGENRVEKEREGRVENENVELASNVSDENADVMDSGVNMTTNVNDDDDITTSLRLSAGNNCSSQCCVSYEKAFQPVDKVLESFSSKGRKFLSQWYKQFPWLNEKLCSAFIAVTLVITI